MSGPAWRFSGDWLRLEERFGYAREVWPQTAAFVGLAPGMRVLDVGCGPGGFALFVAESVAPGGEVVGIDRDAELLRDARERAQASGARARFEEGDALKLPFPDASFDAVVSAFLLCVLPSPLEALREMKRVTRPGGVVASLSCFCKSGIFPAFPGVDGPEGEAGADELEHLRRRFADARRTQVRNPALGLSSGRDTTVREADGTVYRVRGPAPDLDVWADYARAGLEELRIRGFLTVFAPSDARWSDAEAREYVEGRRRIELSMLDTLTDAQRDQLARGGFPSHELDDLRARLATRYEWLLADDARIRRNMELVCDPAVLIAGRVPKP